VTCVDATHATGCNLDTGVTETFDCVAELKALGIVSSGCKTTADGDTCAVDSFSDAACVDGTQRIAYCENATDEEALNVYISCFTDYMGAHTIVPCFSQYVTDTMKTAGNCADAEAACFGSGAGGAGGSPSLRRCGLGVNVPGPVRARHVYGHRGRSNAATRPRVRKRPA
jgi:hypothetical protein